MTRDAYALLLRSASSLFDVTGLFADCSVDYRNPVERTKHLATVLPGIPDSHPNATGVYRRNVTSLPKALLLGPGIFRLETAGMSHVAYRRFFQ